MASLPLDVAVPAAPAPEVMLRQLTASMAHNVNNALTGVIGYLELALNQPGAAADKDACVRSGLDCAYQAADAVRRIVRCARSISEAEPPAPQSLRRLAEAAAERHGQAKLAGVSASQVLVSAGLVGLALDGLLRAVPSEGGAAVKLRVADEAGRCVLYVEGGAAAPDLALRLLEPSLMVEIHGGALDVLSSPDQPALLKLSFPCRNEAPVRRDGAQNAATAPHRSAGIALLRQAV